MRIDFFILSLRENGGGAQQNAIAFIRALRANGHEVVVHTMLGEKGDNPPPDILPISVSVENRSFLDMQRMVAAELARYASKADVFFISGQSLLWGAAMYRKKGKVPVAVYLDSHLDSMKEAYRSFGTFHRWKHRLWQRVYGLRLARHVDRYIAISPYLAEKYVQYGFPKEAMTVVPIAFTFETAVPTASSREVGILYVGRFSYEKGVDTLLEALALLKDEKWHARIVGDGPLRRDFERFIKEKSLDRRVELVLWLSRPELAREYASADILAVPSRIPEPFGVTIVEAMAHGVSVVVPRYGGAAWVAGGAGIEFKNGDAKSLSETLRTLLSDPHARTELGERGKTEAARFDARRVGEQLSRVLEDLRTK